MAKRCKTFLATWRPAGGVIRVVLARQRTSRDRRPEGVAAQTLRDRNGVEFHISRWFPVVSVRSTTGSRLGPLRGRSDLVRVEARDDELVRKRLPIADPRRSNLDVLTIRTDRPATE